MSRVGYVQFSNQHSQESIYETCQERLPRLQAHLEAARISLDDDRLLATEEMLSITLAQVQYELYGETRCLELRGSNGKH